MAPLLLAATLAVQQPLSVQTLRPEQGPTLLVHRQAAPLVALRLSAPAPAELPEGAVELLQELARPAAEAAARRFGARLELRHDAGRAVMAVTGPATAFDALVAILRRATAEPDLSMASLRRARARAESRVLARLEQPGPRIRRLLRHGLYGGPEPTGATATGLDPESIRRVRARLYDPARVQVVLVGSVPLVVVRSAFAGWPPGGSTDGAPATAPDTGAAPAEPQAHREWGGIAFGVEADPAVMAVAAELIHERVRRSVLRYGGVETWHEPSPALAVIGAAAPGDTVVRVTAGISDLEVVGDADVSTVDVRRYLRRLIAEAAALTGPDAVAAARSTVRRRLLLEARTATGKADVIGRLAHDAGAGATPETYLRRLDAVDLEAVRRFLTRVLDAPAVVAEGR